jgi:hypothetical protein
LVLGESGMLGLARGIRLLDRVGIRG